MFPRLAGNDEREQEICGGKGKEKGHHCHLCPQIGGKSRPESKTWKSSGVDDWYGMKWSYQGVDEPTWEGCVEEGN